MSTAEIPTRIERNTERMAKLLLCLMAALILLSWLLLVEITANYITLSSYRDTFYLELVFLVIFVFIMLFSALGAVRSLVRGGAKRDKIKSSKKLVCNVAIVAFASLAFWFRRDAILLGDEIFFRLNEAAFEKKIIELKQNQSAAVLHQRSLNNFHKLFVYVPGDPLKRGSLSLGALDALGEGLGAFRGCKIDAMPLKERFYILSVNCG